MKISDRRFREFVQQQLDDVPQEWIMPFDNELVCDMTRAQFLQHLSAAKYNLAVYLMWAALNPDQPQPRWLIRWLSATGIELLVMEEHCPPMFVHRQAPDFATVVRRQIGIVASLLDRTPGQLRELLGADAKAKITAFRYEPAGGW